MYPSFHAGPKMNFVRENRGLLTALAKFDAHRGRKSQRDNLVVIQISCNASVPVSPEIRLAETRSGCTLVVLVFWVAEELTQTFKFFQARIVDGYFPLDLA